MGDQTGFPKNLPHRRKSRLKERKFTLTSKGANLMSKVVYRGVEYNTTERPNQTFKREPHVEIYRGTMFYVDENGNKLSMERVK